MELSVGEGFRILFEANHVNNPRDTASRIDWAKVSRIKIVGIRNDSSHK